MSFVARRAAAALTAAAALVAPGAVQAAAPLQVAVHADVISDEAVAGGLDAVGVFDVAAEAISYFADLQALRRHVMRREGLDAGIGACGTDVACIGAKARGAGVDLVLVTVVNLEIEPALIVTQLVGASSDTVRQRGVAEVPHDQDLRRALLDHVSAVLVEDLHPRLGRLVVDMNPRDAALSIDGLPPPSRMVRGGWLVEPGLHEVLATAPDHRDASAVADVPAGGEVTLSLALEPESSWVRSPWLWIAVGVVVAAGATTAALAATTGDPGVVVCHASSPARCN